MLKAIEVKPDVYWVGAIDWNERLFDGHAIDYGGTYNAYLILDEKTVLIDTVEGDFSDELIARISDVIDPASIDYIISQHGELDHSGSILKMCAVAPHAQVVTSSPQGAKILKGEFGLDDVIAMKSGESLSIGKRTLTFTATPMVHWPDNMVTYSDVDRILFSNDSFGQHYATSGRFDDEVNLAAVMHEARKYYANIVWPYSAKVQVALEALAPLDIDMIAPAHGVIWRSHKDVILKAYREWAACTVKDHAVVVYDSMYHTTEAMAKQIVDVFTDEGIPVNLYDLKANPLSRVIGDALDAKYLAVGSPTLNMQMMPNVAAFLCYLKGLIPKNLGRTALAFGSYGWAPKGPQMVAEALWDCGYELGCDVITRQWREDDEGLAAVASQVKAVIDAVQAK